MVQDRNTSVSRWQTSKSGKIQYKQSPRDIASAFQQRKNLRTLDHGTDLSPKSLKHRFFLCVEDKHATIFDVLGTNQSGSTTELASTSPRRSGLKTNSMSSIRSSCIHANVLPSEEIMESILSAQVGVSPLQDFNIDEVPFQFCLPRFDSRIFYSKPLRAMITIKETKTFFLLEMPQLTAELSTQEGLMVKEANERYEFITSDARSNRKLVNTETQTPTIHTKPRSTYVVQKKRQNRGTFVNDWVTYNTYKCCEFFIADNQRFKVNLKDIGGYYDKEMDHFVTPQTLNFFRRFGIDHEFLKTDPSVWSKHENYAIGLKITKQLTVINDVAERGVRLFSDYNEILTRNEQQKQFILQIKYHESQMEDLSMEDQLALIYNQTSFRDAIRVMECIIVSNLYITAQKRYKDLIRKNPCSLDFELTYTLNHLWSHSCSLTQDRKVSCCRWNPVDVSLLAAGYGPSPSDKTGFLLLWCMKNPDQPDRIYRFPSSISDANWSRNKPNQLAIGFYDGSISIIDVSKKDLFVIRKSSRCTSPSYLPHWQVQWWSEDEQYDYQENIYTGNQDGRIMCYRTGEDFMSSEIMRIPRIDGKIGGIRILNHCNVSEISVSQNPGAVLLQRHPHESTVYFVGTDEGCIHRCSTNYLHQHIDSFLAHDGPVYSFDFSPFCSKIFLTCGADWCTRIWVDGINEPLITLSTEMACVRGATWSPTKSTVIASIANNAICIWDIKSKTYKPTSITVSPNSHRFVMISFKGKENKLIAADVKGDIHIFRLDGIYFSLFDQTSLLVKSIKKALVTKPDLLRQLNKIGSPF